MPWEWWAIGSLGLSCAWLVADDLGVRRRLRAALAREAGREKPPRKVRLVGGPMDGRETVVSRTTEELHFPIVDPDVPAASWAAEGGLREPVRKKFRRGIYRTPDEMHYRGEG